MAIVEVKKKQILLDDEDLKMIREFSGNSIQIMQGKGKRNPHACIKKMIEVPVKKGRKVTMTKTPKLFQLSRLIMRLEDPTKRIIFENDNTLDLRKKNLKVVDAGEASRRKVKIKGTTSRYMGVHWSTDAGKWRAVIKPDPKSNNVHLGYFIEEEDAAKAYDASARKLFGTRAALNFPEAVKVKKTKKKAA